MYSTVLEVKRSRCRREDYKRVQLKSRREEHTLGSKTMLRMPAVSARRPITKTRIMYYTDCSIECSESLGSVNSSVGTRELHKMF